VRLTPATRLLLGAIVAGGFVWAAGHINEDGIYTFWVVYGLIAVGGLVLALSRLPLGAPPRLSRRAFCVAFVPVALLGLWLLAFNEPQDNWLRAHVRQWMQDVRLYDVGSHFFEHRSAIALGIGFVLGLTFEAPSRQG
jgi:hypothetical protein